MSTEIDDLRQPAQFKGTTFSGFKKTEVRKQMLENMIKGRVEQACYWCAELICAGQFLDAWENIFHFMGKHIHLGNPKMAIYVEMRYSVFRNIMAQGLYISEIQVRNNPEIRRLFAEVICNLTLSPRKPSFESVKIQRKEEFDMTQMSERLKATSTDYAKPIFREKDPQELLIAINEFAYQISIKNMSMCCYWIEWVIEFDLVCKSKKQHTRCVPRDYPVENKFRQDIIWLIWDALKQPTPSPFVAKIMDSILNIFCIKYTSAAAKRRRYLLYMAVELLTEPILTSPEIITDKAILSSVITQIDNVYKQIKKNEHGSGMDYLFGKSEKEVNFQKTVQRLEMMREMDIV
jgi:hypothetical protein